MALPCRAVSGLAPATMPHGNLRPSHTPPVFASVPRREYSDARRAVGKALNWLEELVDDQYWS